MRLTILFLILLTPTWAQYKRFVSATPLTSPSEARRADIGRNFAVQSFSLSLEAAAGVYAAKEYVTDFNGVTHLLFKQNFGGIEVYGADFAVNLDRDGRVLNAGGELFSNPGSFDPALFGASASREAARAAVASVAPAMAGRFQPFETPATRRAARAVQFAAGGLAGDVQGEPIWYPVNGTLIPAWLMNAVNEDGTESYDVIVDAASRRVLRRDPTTYSQNPRGLVYEKGSPQPNPKPGTLITTPPPVVDRTMQSFAGDPVASPLGWVRNNQTAGNNAVVGENLVGISFLATPRITTAPNGDFSFPISLPPAAVNTLPFTDAVNTNLFYWINLAHDNFYRLGFTETAGNFQQSNLGRGGADGDPVYAFTHFGAAGRGSASLQNAFFSLRGSGDGSLPMVAMFLSKADFAPIYTDGALDAQVIVHEYTHGVSNRLVAGCYSVFQCAAMGEAWSDYFGMEFSMPSGTPLDGAYPTGEYFTYAYGTGIRSRPYSTDLAINALTYDVLGRVYAFPEVHADGEIWANTLWEVRAALIKQLGEAEGRRRANQIIVDGMKLTTPRPTMVDARDGILLAERVDYSGASQTQLWAAFAKRGLGALAYSGDANSLHILASFAVPSNKGQLQIMENPLSAGETIRVLLNDNNNPNATAAVRLTSSSGDLEDIVLRRQGSLFAGTIAMATGGVNAQNSGSLKVIPGDAITAYYLDNNSGSGSELIQSTVNTQQGYFIRTQPSFAVPAARETRVPLNNSYYQTVTLPFEFPFFSRKYRRVFVDGNGALLFDGPPFSACNDTTALSRQPIIAPLWAQSDYGDADSGVYVSAAPNTVTFRWQFVTYDPISGQGTPLNFAATLRDDGQIFFTYGDNPNPKAAFFLNGCGSAPTTGISSGHETFQQSLNLSTYNRIPALNWLPPFGFSDFPSATVESPAAGDKVSSVLTVSGYASDTDLPISRVDILIDGRSATNVGLTVARPDVCRAAQASCGGFTTNLDLPSLNIGPGQHTLQVRVNNARGGFQDFPATPVAFSSDATVGRVPEGKLESPAAGDTVSATFTVRGYAYAQNLRVAAIDTLIDGVTTGRTVYGGARTDICNALPAPRPPNCPNVGFTASINTRDQFGIPLSDGNHSIQFRVRDELGRLTLIPDQPVTFKVANGPLPLPVGAIQSIKNNDTLTGVVPVEGYAYQTDDARILSVTVYVQGQAIGAAQTGLPNPQACQGLTGVAACPNVGFRYMLDTRNWPNGASDVGVLIQNSRNQYTWVPGNAYFIGYSVIFKN